MKQPEIFSWAAIGRIIATLAVIYLIWNSISVFIVILISLIMAVALYPMARKLHSWRIPNILSIIVVIILLLIPLIALVAITASVFADQFPQVVALLAPHLSKFGIATSSLTTNLVGYVQGNFSTFVTSTKEIGVAILAVFTTIFLAFYFMLDAEHLFSLLEEVFPKQKRIHMRNLSTELSEVVGQYIRGNLLISLICIAIIYAGLALLHIPFALPLAIFTGIMDLLPVIGPILGALPAVVLGFAISPLYGMLVLVLYVAYKQLEDVALSPIIYNKTLKLSAALIFISVVIGAGFFGVIGAFLALPVAASIPVIIKYKEAMMAKEGE
jgi:predicted PurR-regulated permease PerM